MYALKKSSSNNDASDTNTLAYRGFFNLESKEPPMLEYSASGKMTSTCFNPVSITLRADT